MYKIKDFEILVECRDLNRKFKASEILASNICGYLTTSSSCLLHNIINISTEYKNSELSE